MFIYDAAMKYRASGTPTVVFAGESTAPAPRATGPPKGALLLGIRAGGGRSSSASIVPTGRSLCCRCRFWRRRFARTLGIQGNETIDIEIAGNAWYRNLTP